ncbi:MAG: hypothetical protein IJH34_03900 [Romboutsia sp.]|nr:hypothetical protein [Romboutsia sp.]
MYIPQFALRQSEIDILKPKLNKLVEIKNLNQPMKAYIVEDRTFEEIVSFVESFREGLNEDVTPIARSNILRAVTLVFNLLLDAQKIKDSDLKTVALASISSSIIGIMNIAPDYGIRLISIIKGKL